jgi:hypothetical protein
VRKNISYFWPGIKFGEDWKSSNCGLWFYLCYTCAWENIECFVWSLKSVWIFHLITGRKKLWSVLSFLQCPYSLLCNVWAQEPNSASGCFWEALSCPDPTRSLVPTESQQEKRRKLQPHILQPG